jgi:hypothetical protein
MSTYGAVETETETYLSTSHVHVAIHISIYLSIYPHLLLLPLTHTLPLFPLLLPSLHLT